MRQLHVHSTAQNTSPPTNGTNCCFLWVECSPPPPVNPPQRISSQGLNFAQVQICTAPGASRQKRNFWRTHTQVGSKQPHTPLGSETTTTTNHISAHRCAVVRRRGGVGFGPSFLKPLPDALPPPCPSPTGGCAP